MRHPLALLCGLVILGGAACGSSDTANPETTTTEAQRTSSTAIAPGTVPTVTRPENPTPVDPAGLPAKAQAIHLGPGASDEQHRCVNYAVQQSASVNPGLADDDHQLAGVTGASIVACVPQDAIAAMVTDGLKARATPEQLQCVREQIVMADPKAVSVFIGGLAINEPSIIASVAQAVDAACGTKLAGG